MSVRPRTATVPAASVLAAGESVATRSLSASLQRPWFLALTDGALAVLTTDGALVYAHAPPSGRNGTVVVRELATPCRVDPSRHTLPWTLPQRVALDGNGTVCCIHDGDEAVGAGAWCADARASTPVFRAVRTPGIARGVGTGRRAVALFATDVWCSADGGRTIAHRWRGDESQPVSRATCSADGDAMVVAGTPAPGARRAQTIRVARAGNGLRALPDAPRGEPIDVSTPDRGRFTAWLDTGQGIREVTLDGDRVRAEVMPLPASRAIGRWGSRTLTFAGSWLRLRERGIGVAARALGPELAAGIAGVTRVGDSVIAVTNTGSLVELSRR